MNLVELLLSMIGGGIYALVIAGYYAVVALERIATALERKDDN